MAVIARVDKNSLPIYFCTIAFTNNNCNARTLFFIESAYCYFQIRPSASPCQVNRRQVLTQHPHSFKIPLKQKRQFVEKFLTDCLKALT